MTASRAPEDLLALLRQNRNAVALIFGSAGIVGGAAEQLRSIYKPNESLVALPDESKVGNSEPLEIYISTVIDRLASSEPAMSEVVRTAGLMHVGIAWEALRPQIKANYGGVTEYSPILKFCRHVRNAAFHGGQITFGEDRRPKAIGPAKWRNVTITAEDEGHPVWPAFVGFPSVLYLVEDAVHEVFPGTTEIMPRANRGA